MAKRKVAAYLRFNPGASRAEREQAVRQLVAYIASKKSWQLERLFTDEDKTARQQKPALEKLLLEAGRGAYKAVVTSTKGRISPDSAKLREYVVRLQRVGCDLFVAADDENLTAAFVQNEQTE